MVKEVCSNCCYFITDEDDLENYYEQYGVCIYNNEDFTPFMKEIIEDMDFSKCREIYDNKKIKATKLACERFVPAEIAGLDEFMEDVRDRFDNSSFEHRFNLDFDEYEYEDEE